LYVNKHRLYIQSVYTFFLDTLYLLSKAVKFIVEINSSVYYKCFVLPAELLCAEARFVSDAGKQYKCTISISELPSRLFRTQLVGESLPIST